MGVFLPVPAYACHKQYSGVQNNLHLLYDALLRKLLQFKNDIAHTQRGNTQLCCCSLTYLVVVHVLQLHLFHVGGGERHVVVYHL